MSPRSRASRWQSATSELAAIRHEAHPTYLPGDAEALRTSYDEFWQVFGATELDEKAYRIPVPLDLGDLTEVASKHRRRAKLRRQHWSEVTESACETIRGHLAKPEPGART